MRRLLIVLAVVFAGPVVIYVAAPAFLAYAFTRLDPYPTFMADYLPNGPSYREARSEFSEFVIRTFPIGSNSADAIAQITSGGFKIIKSSSQSIELQWRRRAGPCSELYSIIISQDPHGSIDGIAGRLDPICL